MSLVALAGAADAAAMAATKPIDMRAARAGASIRELMDRMGHSSTRAAMIYQHGSHERQREVADRLDSLARGQLTSGSGTQRARKPKKAK
ncbi:integrase [Streptosporangium album]|uniref:Integrase n=1 Tax=Streptosporangium album TaxID=47479 RepID=A0A7W7RUJ6_9ACTN|nr:hypothetical protein [Streptosporangium album]MBB4938417.1 integrase [Streptosporangium album]